MWNTVRSFGLDYNDFPTMFANIALLLRLITIDIDKNSKPISFFCYIVTAIAIVCYFYVYIFSLCWMIFCYYGQAGDWIAASVVLGLGACSYPCVTKFLFMKLYAEDLKNTVAAFLECDSHVTPVTRFAFNLKKYLKIVKRRATIIGGSLITIGSVYLSVPFLRPGRHFTLDFYILYGLVPMHESPNYEIATIVNIIGSEFCMYTMGCTAIYVIVIVGYIEAQMRALSEELDNLWGDSHEFYEKTINNLNNPIYDNEVKERVINEFIGVRLRDIIKFHIKNINLMHEVDRNIRPTLALECAIIGFSIVAELLGGLEHTYLQIPYSMVQVFMDCLAGQRLIDACNDFEFAIYSCKWQHFSAKNQKKILLLLATSQRTLVLTAGGIVYLNFSCLMSMLKSTYSIYTTLNSMIT